MSIACTVCGLWYTAPGRDTLDICPPCFRANFAGAQPPLDLRAPSARAALEDYVDATLRQEQARRRLPMPWEEDA